MTFLVGRQCYNRTRTHFPSHRLPMEMKLSWLTESLREADTRRVITMGWLVAFMLMGLYCACYQMLFLKILPEPLIIAAHIARDWLPAALLTPPLFSVLSRHGLARPQVLQRWRSLLGILVAFSVPSVAVRVISDMGHHNLDLLALFFYVPRVVFAYASIAGVWFLMKASKPAAQPLTSPTHQSPQYTKAFVTHCGRDLVTVDAADIHWIGASGNYAELHNAQRSYLLRETMKRLESQLDPNDFLRIHRSYIVHRSHIHSVRQKPSGSAQLQLISGEVLPVSKHYKSRLPHFAGTEARAAAH